MTNEATKATDEIRDMIRDMLQERFEDEFEFGPIVTIPRFDHDDIEYLHTYIVFNGDQKKLDPAWTLRLPGRLWPRAEELGYPGIPITLWVKKSEWSYLERSLA